MRNKSSGEKLSIAPLFFCVSYDALFSLFCFSNSCTANTSMSLLFQVTFPYLLCLFFY